MDAPARLLRLLSLLSARPSWTADELAERLAVTPRTVRRDVARLRELGYPVDATSGPYGGYELGAGGALPPLLLDDDEAVAVAVGLREAADGGVVGLEDATVSALAKLEQVLPARLASRVRAVYGVTTSLRGRDPEAVDASVLVELAQSCRRAERLRLGYVDRAGEATERLVEPYRLVRATGRWYLAARDASRGEWRTFRVDRVTGAAATGQRFDLVDPPDPAGLVARGMALSPYPFRARLRLRVPPERAAEVVPRTVGVASPDGDGHTLVELGGGDLPSMTRWLAGLPCACEVLDPPELRAALRDHAERLAAANR